MTALAASYATRQDLLERCNVQRLAQLAAPTGTVMPPVDQVRAVLLELDREPMADDEAEAALAEAVVAVDAALADAADLMRSYGVPPPATWAAARPPAVLVRVNCQLAMHYLLERAGMLAESDSANYNALLKLLQRHASGEMALVPVDTAAGGMAASADVAVIASGRTRYGVRGNDLAGDAL